MSFGSITNLTAVDRLSVPEPDCDISFRYSNPADDYDSEYRYESQPIPALQGMDRANLVIYIGTFSKILCPSLRIGYLVVPPDLIPVVSKANWLCDRFCPILEQYALTDWIKLGYFERHIRRMRQLYNLRRQALITALEKYLGDCEASRRHRIFILGENAEIHLMAKIKTDLYQSSCRTAEVFLI